MNRQRNPLILAASQICDADPESATELYLEEATSMAVTITKHARAYNPVPKTADEQSSVAYDSRNDPSYRLNEEDRMTEDNY